MSMNLSLSANPIRNPRMKNRTYMYILFLCLCSVMLCMPNSPCEVLCHYRAPARSAPHGNSCNKYDAMQYSYGHDHSVICVYICSNAPQMENPLYNIRMMSEKLASMTPCLIFIISHMSSHVSYSPVCYMIMCSKNRDMYGVYHSYCLDHSYILETFHAMIPEHRSNIDGIDFYLYISHGLSCSAFYLPSHLYQVLTNLVTQCIIVYPNNLLCIISYRQFDSCWRTVQNRNPGIHQHNASHTLPVDAVSAPLQHDTTHVLHRLFDTDIVTCRPSEWWQHCMVRDGPPYHIDSMVLLTPVSYIVLNDECKYDAKATDKSYTEATRLIISVLTLISVKLINMYDLPKNSEWSHLDMIYVALCMHTWIPGCQIYINITYVNAIFSHMLNSVHNFCWNMLFTYLRNIVCVMTGVYMIFCRNTQVWSYIYANNLFIRVVCIHISARHLYIVLYTDPTCLYDKQRIRTI